MSRSSRRRSPAAPAGAATGGPLRALILTAAYPSPDDPVCGRAVRDGARAAALRHQVVVVVAGRPARRAGRRPAVRDGVEWGLRTVRVAPWGPSRAAGRLPALRRGVQHVRRTGFEPEVMHAHGFTALVAAVLMRRRTRAPVVASEYYAGFAAHSAPAPRRAAVRLAFEAADAVCPVSEDLGQQIAALAPRARVRPVPVPIAGAFDAPAQAPCERQAGGPARLLAVALLHRHTGVEVLLDAVARLRRRGEELTLDIAGDGPARAELERHAEQLGLAQAVQFHGLRDPGIAGVLMRRCDVFVQPGRVEEVPPVLIEAMGSGLPVVTTAVGPVAELVDEDVGIVAPPERPADLADALAAALRRRASFDAGTIAARARERFSDEAVSRRWDEVYREVAGPSRFAGAARQRGARDRRRPGRPDRRA